MKTQNIPYIKKYDENGIVLNPITKEKPYNSGISKRQFYRGHRKIEVSNFLVDRFGNPKITVKRKNRKGKWIDA